ncbi:hypothetical protein E4U11_004226 [Claviceps purpurea]|nr:hypothetical protein E4U11_004226 [Claviceps purpurea]
MVFKASIHPSDKCVPRLDLLRKMLLWAGDGGARKIVIPTTLEITRPALTLLLEASPRLEYLDIQMEHGQLTLPSNETIWDRFRNVSITGRFYKTPVDLPGGFPHTFLQNAASTLEHLTLVSIPREWYNSVPKIPRLHKLKSLRMEDWVDMNIPFPIYFLSVAFPRLEQLSFAALSELRLEPVAIRRKELKNIWPHLKVLMFQSEKMSALDEAGTYSILRYLASLNSLQHIKFTLGHPRNTDQYADVFGGNYDLRIDSRVSPQLQMQNLRSLRSQRMRISPERARTLLSNAVKNEKLTSFDIVFPWEEMNGCLTADASVRHLKGYDWLRGNPTIHTLGCQDFLFSFDLKDEESRLLPQFLATFPNLRKLTIFSKHYRFTDLAKLVLEILKVTHLRTIYTLDVRYPEFLTLKEVARSKGAEIIKWLEPQIWPIFLEQ